MTSLLSHRPPADRTSGGNRFFWLLRSVDSAFPPGSPDSLTDQGASEGVEDLLFPQRIVAANRKHGRFLADYGAQAD